jgi:hypothetical protein
VLTNVRVDQYQWHAHCGLLFFALWVCSRKEGGHQSGSGYQRQDGNFSSFGRTDGGSGSYGGALLPTYQPLTSKNIEKIGAFSYL